MGSGKAIRNGISDSICFIATIATVRHIITVDYHVDQQVVEYIAYYIFNQV